MRKVQMTSVKFCGVFLFFFFFFKLGLGWFYKRFLFVTHVEWALICNIIDKIVPEICSQSEKVLLSKDEFLWIWDLYLLMSFTVEVEIIHNQPNGGMASASYDLLIFITESFLFSQPEVWKAKFKSHQKPKSVRYKELG